MQHDWEYYMTMLHHIIKNTEFKVFMVTTKDVFSNGF